jgi:hypothetical protein
MMSVKHRKIVPKAVVYRDLLSGYDKFMVHFDCQLGGAGLQYYLFLPYIFGETAPTNRVYYKNTTCLI